MPFEHVLPVGLRLAEPGSVALEECYEAQWRDDEDPPHWFFWVQLSALRLGRVAADALAALPQRVHAVLEVRRDDDELAREPDGPAVQRWVSPVLPRESVLRVWRRHAGLLVHDGMLGFGAWDPESPLEVFVDDHKLLSLFAPETDPFEALLRSHRVPEASGLTTVLDADHEHLSIAHLRATDPEARRLWGRSKANDAAWAVPSIRRALRMQPQESPANDEGG